MYRNKIVILLILIIASGCKDEFLLESQGFKPLLVVDGIITNEAPPYTIKLYHSSPLNTKEKFSAQSCMITLIENTGKTETLIEVEPGKYISSQNGIQGTIGNQYKIEIITPDGNDYETEFQEIKQPVEIDSIYAEFKHKEVLGYPFGLPGYQFYTSTKKAKDPDSYILWNMEETFQYHADYELYAVSYGDSTLFVNLNQLPEYENVYRCWKTQNSGYIVTGKTTNLENPAIYNQPLYFVGTDTRQLQERFSLLLLQYTITKEAYYHWKSTEDQISQENFLESHQPYNIKGNVKNINNPDEPVYGYFTVASVDQKRIFVDRPYTAFYYQTCVAIKVPVSFTPVFFGTDEYGDSGALHEPCIDCRSNGGITIKPDFWIDY